MPVTEDTKPNDNLGGFTNYKQKYGSMKSKLKAILYVSIKPTPAELICDNFHSIFQYTNQMFNFPLFA